MHMEKCFHWGTAPLSKRKGKQSGRNDRNEIEKRKFDKPKAETDGTSRLLRSKQNQKTTIPKLEISFTPFLCTSENKNLIILLRSNQKVMASSSSLISGKDSRKSYSKIIKTVFSPEKVTLQTACKSGSNCLVYQLSDSYKYEDNK